MWRPCCFVRAVILVRQILRLAVSNGAPELGTPCLKPGAKADRYFLEVVVQESLRLQRRI